MINRKLVTLILVALAGTALSFAVIPLIGRTMAIAAPVGLFDWFRSVATVELASLLWDFAVVGLLGAGIAVFLTSLVALKAAGTSRAATLIAFVAGFFLGGHVLAPYYYGQAEHITTVLLNRPWWGYGIDLSVVFSAVAAAIVHWRVSRRRSGR